MTRRPRKTRPPTKPRASAPSSAAKPKPSPAAKPKRSASPVRYFSFAGQKLAVVSTPIMPALPSTLTATECEVVAQIMQGKSNAQIARARGVAVRTIANQVAAILKKLGVGSRAGLVAYLSRHATDV